MQHEEQNEKDFLKELAPTLFGETRFRQMEPPPGYFDTFYPKVKDKIAAQESAHKRTPAKVLKLISYRKLALAAGVAALTALVSWMVNQNESQQLEPLVWDEATIEAATEYLSLEWLIESITDEEVDLISFANPLPDAALEEYLFEQGYSDDLYFE